MCEHESKLKTQFIVKPDTMVHTEKKYNNRRSSPQNFRLYEQLTLVVNNNLYTKLYKIVALWILLTKKL